MVNYTPLVDGETPAHEAINQRLDDLASAAAVLAVGAGFVTLWGGNSPPTGYLLCDGSAVSRSSFAALFAAIGTTFGIGNGSTTFNLPDLRGRAAAGSGQGGSLTLRTIGDTLGEENHQLTIPEMASHNHSQINYVGGASVGTAGSGRPFFNGGASLQTSDTGSDTPHNNMQPSLVTNFIIKT